MKFSFFCFAAEKQYIYAPYRATTSNKMRHIVLPVIFMLALLQNCFAGETPLDSLKSVLLGTSDPKTRVRIYRDMADLTAETQESCGYLVELVETARKCGLTRPMMEALTELSINHTFFGQLDSARYYRALAEKYAPKGQQDQWCCLIDMRIFVAEMLSPDARQILDEKINAFKNRDLAKESVYKQILAEYTLGTALYNSNDNEEATPYLERAFNLASQLPFQDGANYQLLILRQFARVYSQMNDKEKAVNANKKAIETKERYYNLYEKPARPYYPIDDFYITYYSSMMLNVEVLPEEDIQFYLRRLEKMGRKSTNPSHKYSCFMTLSKYSIYRKNIREALIYNDSMIHYARIVAPYNLPNIYYVRSVLYESLNQSQDALKSLRQSYDLKDSVLRAEANVQYDKLRVEYDVNRLNYENAQLEVRNKQIMLIGVTAVLLLSFILCTYLYIHLRRAQKTKARMQQLKLQAEESEKLKTAFINSICHEIRTPLNGIAGFAQLLTDPTIAPEERESFYDEVRSNTDQLVTLVDGMLEVANLDVSDEKLPCLPTDLVQLCREVCAIYIHENRNPNLTITMQTPEKSLIAATNHRYLTLVLDCLLDNAVKFTESGSITVGCKQKDGQVELSVADTGPGIPPENHRMVFDRFTKLDIYKKGGGLGLYLSKIIVRRLSGSIYIDPDYTGGTRVAVILPLE